MRELLAVLVCASPFLAELVLSQSGATGGNTSFGTGQANTDTTEAVTAIKNDTSRTENNYVESFRPASQDGERISGDPESANDFFKVYQDLQSNQTIKHMLDKHPTSPDEWTIWSIDKVPARWPVICAAVPPGLDYSNRGPPNFQDADSNTYTWTFDVVEEDLPTTCTDSKGEHYASPCTGKVVNRWFIRPGKYGVTLQIQKPGEEEPITIKKEVEVVEAFSEDPVQRYEIRDIPRDVWVKLMKGMYKLKATRIYDYLVQLHAASFELRVTPGNPTRSTGHGGPGFLPFHRAFTRVLEYCLQHAMDDRSIGHPYWDWTLDAENEGGLASEIFTNRWYGPTGDTNSDRGGFLTTGPFCGVPNEVEESCYGSWYIPEAFRVGVNVRRQLGRTGLLPTQEEVDRILAVERYDAPPYSDKPSEIPSFRAALEGWQEGEYGSGHNGVHQWVGGNMYNVYYAVSDPIFFLHHCNVDRIYTLWQQRHQCYESCYRPQRDEADITLESVPGALQDDDGKAYILGAHIGDELHPFGMRIFELVSRPNETVVGNVAYVEPGETFVRGDPVPIVEDDGSDADRSEGSAGADDGGAKDDGDDSDGARSISQRAAAGVTMRGAASPMLGTALVLLLALGISFV